MKLRNALVVFKSTQSVILIAATVVICKQLAYIRNTNTSFNREQLLVIQNTDVLKNQASAFRVAFFTTVFIKVWSTS
jgi:putative ABC transport system permease protein